jgi:acyl-CoA reductase-like NAD-dependent aldehyde dehydrogenase
MTFRTMHTTHRPPYQLGGKDPAYVRPDADLDYTVPELVDGTHHHCTDFFSFSLYAGAMFNSGQSCCAVEVSC